MCDVLIGQDGSDGDGEDGETRIERETENTEVPDQMTGDGTVDSSVIKRSGEDRNAHGKRWRNGPQLPGLQRGQM